MLGTLLEFVFSGLGRVAGFVFSRTGLVFGTVIGLIVLIGGLYLLNKNRLGWKTSSESWQASSELWKTHAGRLERDTVRLFAESARVQQLNAKLNQQASDATGYAYDYKAKYEKAVAVSDRQTDQLTGKDQKIQFWKALVANKTLPPTYIGEGSLFAGGDSAVTNAGLKTAQREAIGRAKLDTLELSVATRDAQIEGLKQERDQASQGRDRAVASSLYAEGSWTREARTKRFLGRGRKKNANATAENIRQVRETGRLPVEDSPSGQTGVSASDSELEQVLNKSRPGAKKITNQ